MKNVKLFVKNDEEIEKNEEVDEMGKIREEKDRISEMMM
jgi:hypothetical protein